MLRPMLIDTQGWAWLLGTPQGLNWFHQEHQAAAGGGRPGSAAWSAPTLGVRVAPDGGGLERAPHPLENPHVPFEEIAELWRTMPERAFRQEILGEFVATEGAVFRRVTEAAVLEPQAPSRATPTWSGVDWGRYRTSPSSPCWTRPPASRCASSASTSWTGASSTPACRRSAAPTARR